MAVHPFVLYSSRLSRSVIGNAGHSAPHVLHDDTQWPPSPDSGHAYASPHSVALYEMYESLRWAHVTDGVSMHSDGLSATYVPPDAAS